MSQERKARPILRLKEVRLLEDKRFGRYEVGCEVVKEGGVVKNKSGKPFKIQDEVVTITAEVRAGAPWTGTRRTGAGLWPQPLRRSARRGILGSG